MSPLFVLFLTTFSIQYSVHTNLLPHSYAVFGMINMRKPITMDVSDKQRIYGSLEFKRPKIMQHLQKQTVAHKICLVYGSD